MKALIIVDMQNDFIDGALGTPEAQAIVPNVVDRLKFHENTDTIILFTKDTHYDDTYADSMEGTKLPVPHCMINTPGWSIVRPIHDEFKRGNYATISTESVINGRVIKSTFGSWDLVDVLANYDLDEIEVCGVCTDICVVANCLLLKTAFPEIPIVVNASCCAGVTPEKHAAALEVMKSCQIDVIGE